MPDFFDNIMPDSIGEQSETSTDMIIMIITKRLANCGRENVFECFGQKTTKNRSRVNTTFGQI